MVHRTFHMGSRSRFRGGQIEGTLVSVWFPPGTDLLHDELPPWPPGAAAAGVGSQFQLDVTTRHSAVDFCAHRDDDAADARAET